MFSERKIYSQRPLVTVCILTYNQCRYIEATVRSVLAQCGQGLDFELEILIGDDHSTDGSSEILARLESQFPENITWIRHPKNLGGHENMRCLLRRATGHYIAHLDGDDYWMPEKIVRQLKRLEVSPSSVACYTNAFVLDAADRFLGIFTNMHPERFSFSYLAARGNFLNFSSTLYKAEAKDLILASEQPMIDYEIHLLLASSGDLSFVDEPLVCYRWMSASSTLRHNFGEFSALYAQALLRTLSATSSSIRYQAVALYILTSLMKRKEWIFDSNFWQLIRELTLKLKLSFSGLIWPIFYLGALGVVARIRAGCTLAMSKSEHAVVMFPRI